MRRRQILIVEDNELDLVLLEEVLQEDYDILKAANGLDALAVLQQNRENISLILLDIVMPVMDGYEFLSAIKDDLDLKLIPVIVMTQADSEGDEVKAFELGATDFIPKPYKGKVIRHRVANLIKLRETAAMVNQIKYDRLTGLYTKDYFYRRVREVLDANPEKEYTILCCNLENFKLYNDTFGRQAGDQLLIEEAKLLKKRVSPDSICCRFTADRFLCLTDKESELKGRECFLKAREKTRSELSENISVKLGIYEIPDRSIPVEKMCDRALWVVNTIKGFYDKHIVVYDETFRKQLLREQIITDAMEEALREGQFVVFFQPKQYIHDGSMVGAEALVRWIHPEWGFLSPGEFIPLFEKNGFICRLDEYVWEKACQKLQQWLNKGYAVVPVSVNVSRADIYQAQLVERLCMLVDKYRIDPSFLHLEITESAYTENPEQIINTVEDLRRRGFVIEMDDFGSGYSSLNMLGKMSIDVLKLDMGFIRTEFEKPLEQSILNDVVNMAHRLHLNVVAEGVETGSQRNQLRELGCDYAQGYYYSKPIPDEEYEKLLMRPETNEAGSTVDQGRRRDYSGENKKCVLVIEDNEINRDLLKELLEEEYVVLTAENGKEGLEKLERYGYAISVILLDIRMPVMDGYAFLEQVKKHSVYSRIPVIVTTVLSSLEEEERCMQMGAVDFIEKPYHSGRILKRIGNLIHMKEYNRVVYGLEIDELTGFGNRKAYFQDIVMIEHDPERKNHPIGILFADINGLKMVNDRDGHEAGDRLIIEIANALRKCFEGDDIYRVGGDEFVVFSFAQSKEEFEKKRSKLENSWSEDHSAALGSVWLEQVAQLRQSVVLADQDMYRSKRKYYMQSSHDRRKNKDYLPGEILRKMDEISEYLPSGFLVYKVEDGEIISLNRELLKLYGFTDEKEFREYTGNTFRGMVYSEDAERVMEQIDAQIRQIDDIDHVEYRILCKDGTMKWVKDSGRRVHSEAYGEVFYVLLTEISENAAKGEV